MENNMSISQHLEELRKILIKSLVFFLLALIVSFVFVKKIYHYLVQPLLGEQLTVLGPAESIRVYLAIAGVVALGLTIPVLLFQIWRFVAPALNETERKAVFRYIPVIFLMFIGGVLFGYFVVFHMLLKVLLEISQEEFRVMLTAGNYFEFLVNIIVPFGIIFEMPVVVMFLTRLGILDPAKLVKMRKYAYFILVIVASILSPPEIISHLSVAAPMILLYELSIQISRVVYRRKQLRMAAMEF